MFSKALIFFACLTVGTPPTIASQIPVGIDPVIVSPDRFTVLLENEHVRIVEYVLLPGQRDQWHTHPAKVSYVVTGGTLRITLEDGTSFSADERAGTVSWAEPLGRHFVENVGESPVRILLIEIKAAAAR